MKYADLPHERLDAFNVAIELVELVAGLEVPRGNSAAVDQLKRAAQSVALNIAEGTGKSGRDRRWGVRPGSRNISGPARLAGQDL